MLVLKLLSTTLLRVAIPMLVLAAMLSGCGVGSMEAFFAKPGKFDYLNCTEINNTTASVRRREQELKELIARAEL